MGDSVTPTTSMKRARLILVVVLLLVSLVAVAAIAGVVLWLGLTA